MPTTDQSALDWLLNQHGIPIAEKTIFLRNCILVGSQDGLAAGKSGYQHHQGRLRQMKIGNHGAYQLEWVSGINEQIAGAVAGHDFIGIPTGEFKGAHTSGAHGHDATALVMRLIDGVRGMFADAVRFGMHAMVANVGHAYGQKCAIAHMQGDGGYCNLARGKTPQQSWRKMKPRRWRGNGAFVFGIDGLILIAIRQMRLGPLNIGRQGRDANLFYNVAKVALEEKPQPVTAMLARNDLGVYILVEKKRHAGPWGFGCFDQAVKFQWRMRGVDRAREIQNQYFSLAAGGLAPDKPTGNNGGIVDDHQVAGLQEAVNFIKIMMLPAIAPAVKNQQPASIALGARLLGNQLRRQVIIVIGQRKHRISFAPYRPGITPASSQ